METGDALRLHVEDRLNAIIDKYFSRALSSVVTFSKAPAGAFRCDIVMHVRQGLILKGASISQDAHNGFDQASDKVETQLRRYKRRLSARQEQAAHSVRSEEAAYTIFVESEPEVEADVMMLDLRNTNALLFKNAGTGKHNMVYRRGDGSIGWVEPS
jgi:ribosomal subunit interface protein